MMTENNNFPFEFKKVDPEVTADIRRKFRGQSYDHVRVGPKGYLFPEKYAAEAALYYTMRVRPSDVFVVTFPRSGTTWTQELVWLIANDFDYKTAAGICLHERFPFLEHIMQEKNSKIYTLIKLSTRIMVPTYPESIYLLSGLSIFFTQKLAEELKLAGNHKGYEVCNALSKSETTSQLAAAPSPRFIKTHLPLSLLPPALADTARIVYVARDPRDVAVSYYHHNRLLKVHEYVGDFKTYWNFFINDLVIYAPYFEYIKEGWEKRHHPNVLFLFYEELNKDLPGSIIRVAKFLEKQVTEEQVAKLTDHLKIENFKKNTSLNDESWKHLGIPIVPNEQSFIRKGKSGGWREYFDEEMARQAARWIADNLRDTDLRFPH